MIGDPAQNILDLMLQNDAPEIEVFTYEIAEGVSIEFEVLSDMVRYNELYSEGAKWVKTMMQLHEENKLSDAWKVIFSPDPKLLAEVFLLCSLAKHQDVKDKYKMFTLARKASPRFIHMYQAVMGAAVKSPAQFEQADLEEAKKG